MKTRTNTLFTALLALLILSAMCATAAADLPAVWDWRDIDGVNYVTPVKDQEGCGACYAFGAVGALEMFINTHGGPELDLSEEQAKECSGYGCKGGTQEGIFSLFSIAGSVLEVDDPYHPYDTQCNQNTPVVRITGWKELSYADRDITKSYVMEYGHVAAGVGSHCIIIVGWNDSLPCDAGVGGWIVKNSAGPGAVNGGFLYVAYDDWGIENSGKSITGYEYHDPHVRTATHVEKSDYGIGYHPSNTAWGMSLLEVSADEEITKIEFDTTGSTSDIDFYIYDGYDGYELGNLLYQVSDMSHDTPGFYSVDVVPPLVMEADTEVAVVGRFVNTGTQWNLNGFCPIGTDLFGAASGKTYVSPTGASGSWTTQSADVSFRLRVAYPFLVGDINEDCVVDYTDLGILGATYGLSLGDPGYNAAADLNIDGTVNYRDLGMLSAHYGEVC